MATLFPNLSKAAVSTVFRLNLLALMLVGLFGVWVDSRLNENFDQQLRLETQRNLDMVRARLAGALNSDIQLVQGLVSTLKTEPNMDQARFAQLAGQLLGEGTRIRNIAAAPDLIIRLMHPLAGNEKAVGLNYRTNEKQRAAVMKVVNGRDTVVAGPVNLVQGGVGIIVRYPVEVGEAGKETIWGIVSAVIDVEKLYTAAGMRTEDLPIDLAIIGKDGKGLAGPQFFGPANMANADPVSAKLLLPNGYWCLLAVPKGGWGQNYSSLWLQRAVIVLAGLLLLLPIFMVVRLSEQRRQNIEKLKLREDKLTMLSRRHRLALDASKMGIWEFNVSREELNWDDKMRELYGLPADAPNPTRVEWKEKLHPEDADQAVKMFEIAIRSNGEFEGDYRIVLPNGDIRFARVIGAAYEETGKDKLIVGVNWDVTRDVHLQNDLKLAKLEAETRNRELEESKSKIEYLALHDSLTALPNRRSLDAELAKIDDSTSSDNQVHALMIVDLDNFKQVNDTYGHAAGDQLLVHVAEILRAKIRATDLVARVGGDEFVVICKTPIDQTDLEWLADSIIEAMQEPMNYQGADCRFGVSVGIAEAALNQGEAPQLLINADLALYAAKAAGRNRYQFFSDSLLEAHHLKKSLADDILRGLEEGEFIPFYQPQFNASTFEVTGVEALARWYHPELGILTPDKFLGVAEDLKVSAIIDRQILQQALQDREDWAANGMLIPKVSVNVSAQRLLEGDLVDELQSLDIQPGTIAFELVESIFLDDTDDRLITNIEHLKLLGIEVEIDDFGTGHTSIISLLKLKPARLKIDKQLVIPILESASSRKLAKLIIDIGKSLDIEVVAEGIESMRHANALHRMGADGLQGFGLGRPMSAADLLKQFQVAERQSA